MPDTLAWGRICDPQAGQPCQIAIEGLEEIQLPPFFSEWLIQDTCEPGPSDAGGCWVGRVLGRRDQWEDQRLCLIVWGCRAILSVQHDHDGLAWTILHTFLIHIVWGTTAPPYLKQYHGHSPSTACIAWDAFIPWQNGRFPLFPGRSFCPTNVWQYSFLPRAHFVPVPKKRDLGAPPKKGIKLLG